MAFKFVIFAACLAIANAGAVGYYAAPAAVGASQQSVVRSLDGNSVVSTYAKQVDTPFSSVRKYDSRVTNDAVAIAHAPVATYAAAPVATYAAAPAYAAYHAPAVATYAAPAVAHTYAAPALAAPVARVGLGVAYSAAPAVAHYSFDGFGTHYAF